MGIVELSKKAKQVKEDEKLRHKPSDRDVKIALEHTRLMQHIESEVIINAGRKKQSSV